MTSRKSTRELRKFGFAMTLPLVLIGGLLLWKESSSGPYLIAIAVMFLMGGLFFPRLLAPVEEVWMKLSKMLSVVSTYVILTLSFFLVVTPMGLFVRLLRKDILHLKFNAREKSYWLPTDPDGPGSRPRKPY